MLQLCYNFTIFEVAWRPWYSTYDKVLYALMLFLGWPPGTEAVDLSDCCKRSSVVASSVAIHPKAAAS